MDELLGEIRRQETRLGWKTGLFRYGLALILFETLSGGYLLFSSELLGWEWAIPVAHFLLGLPLVISLFFLWSRARLYMRAWPVTRYRIAGWSTISGLTVSLITGIAFIWPSIESKGAVWWGHVVFSIAGVAALVAFLAWTLAFAERPLSRTARKAFRATIARISGQIFALFGIFCAGVALATLWNRPPLPLPLNYARTFVKKNPFFPAHLRTESFHFLSREALTESRSCGGSGCHQGIVRQWEQSAHYRTPNPFFSAAVRKLIEEGDRKELFNDQTTLAPEKLRRPGTGREVARFCAGCHAPVALVSGAIDGLTDDLGSFKKFEGNSCILCHRISDFGDHSDGTFTVLTTAPLPFVRERSGLGRRMHEMLMRVKPEAHGQAFFKPEYKQSNYCATCHQRLQHSSWAAGPYNDKLNPKEGKTCQSCHMPQIPMDDISARKKGTAADHRFLSAGFALADFYGLKDQLQATAAFIRDRKMVMSLAVKKAPAAGETLNVLVRIGNIGVGHSFPAGPELDLVEAWPEITVTNERGQVLAAYGKLDDDGNLDDSTRIYRARPYDVSMRPLGFERHRSWLFSHDVLFVIDPRTYDEFTVPLAGKWNGSSVLTLEARLRYRKPNQRFADWALGKGTFRVPIVDVARSSLTVSSSREQPATTSPADEPDPFLKLRRMIVQERMHTQKSVHERILQKISRKKEGFLKSKSIDCDEESCP